MSARAGIVITGTEVLAGIIPDGNGPWLSERLRERGVQLGYTIVVGDRREDLLAALRFLAGEGVELIITSGGLGPTADDLTTEVVAEFAGRPMARDEALEGRIRAILERNRARWRHLDEEAMLAGNRKQAIVPEGSTVLEPVGTAPGLVVAPRTPDLPTVLVLPGPPPELQPMWDAALETEALRAALAGAGSYEQRMMRLYGIPEAQLAQSLREIEAEGVPLDRLEITTCLRRGELEIATVLTPDDEAVYARFVDGVRARHGEELFSEDGSTVDEQVARLLTGRSVAVAESCTGGLMAARLTDRAGSSAYVLGGAVVYSNAAKTELAGVDPALIARVGAVSAEVAGALAEGAAARFGAELGIGITGIAGPGGGSEDKPVGTVFLSVAGPGGGRGDLRVQIPGDRGSVRERTTTIAMHLLRERLL